MLWDNFIAAPLIGVVTHRSVITEIHALKIVQKGCCNFDLWIDSMNKISIKRNYFQSINESGMEHDYLLRLTFA